MKETMSTCENKNEAKLTPKNENLNEKRVYPGPPLLGAEHLQISNCKLVVYLGNENLSIRFIWKCLM